jgi:serine/threonine-protein kinase RsbT
METGHGHILEVLLRYASGPTARGMLRRALTQVEQGHEAGNEGSVNRIVAALEQGVRLFVDERQQASALAELHALAPSPQQQATVPLETERDARRARLLVREILTRLGVSKLATLQLATVVSELSRNILMYAGGGEIEFRVGGGLRRRVIVVARDRGPGIQNLPAILAGTYRSHTGMGRGLFCVQQLADSLDVDTGPTGTTVTFEADLP